MTNTFLKNYGPWALVTGASSGIGAEFCRQLAAKGLNIVLTARRLDRLNELAAELKSRYGIETKVVPADLSKSDFISTIMPEISSIEIGLLVNNAGFGQTGEFLKSDLERELDMLNVNCMAPLLLTHSIGQQMVKRNKGGIIFLSSVLGFTPTPYFANYAASKAYNLYLGEALWYELKQHGIDVTSLSPGTTRTEFGKASGMGNIVAMEVEPVVTTALQNLGKKPSIVAGIHNKAFIIWFKLTPRKLLTIFFGSVLKRMQKIKY